jgi:Spy/CpxP family protein refolding chaperone
MATARLLECKRGKMKRTILTQLLLTSLATVSLTLSAIISVDARSLQDPEAPPTEPRSGTDADPIPLLRLSPEQRQRIRAINEENQEERQRVNRQLREAQRALNQSLDVDSPSQDLIDERIRDVAQAHAAQIRIRVLQELRIRSVLTPDQVRLWKTLRARNLRRRLNNADREGRGERILQERRNGLRPGLEQRQRRRPPL